MNFLKCNASRKYCAFAILALILTTPIPSIHRSPAPSKNFLNSPLGVIVPLYTLPGQSWETVLQAKQAYPMVKMIVIVDPSNGPGSAKDQSFASGIAAFQKAGIAVLGYVYTAYGVRNAIQVNADVKNWKGWYNVNGIFFDEMASVPGFEQYYSNLSSFARSQDLNFTVGNTGMTYVPPKSYLGIMNVVNLYEGTDFPTQDQMAKWTHGYSKSNFALLAIGRQNLTASLITNASRYISWIFVSDGVMPNPYGRLPSYFNLLIAEVAGYASAGYVGRSSGNHAGPFFAVR